MQLYKIKPQTVNNFIPLSHQNYTHFQQKEMKIMFGVPIKSKIILSILILI